MIARIETKAAVSVTDMAKMVGLSRQRFHQLVREGIFPVPKKGVSNSRPYYDTEQQEICLNVRRQNQGVNGELIMFYSARTKTKPAKTVTKKANSSQHAELVEALKGLGMTAKPEDVAEVMKVIFPDGTEGKDAGEVTRQVFLQLRQRNRSDNVE